MNESFEIPMEDAADAGDATEAPRDAMTRLSAMVGQLLTVARTVADLDERLAKAQAEQTRLEREDIPQLMKECGFKKVALEDGTTVEIQEDFACGISEERRGEAFAWLKEHKLDGIIKVGILVPFGRGEAARANALAEELGADGFDFERIENVHWQTLKATLKELREKGVGIPAETFGLFPFDTTKLKLPAGQEAPRKPRKRK